MSIRRTQLRALMKLVGPMTISDIGIRLMMMVDMAMVAPLGKGPLAAYGLGTFYAATVTLFALQMLDPMEVMVSRAIGAGKPEEVGSSFRAGLVLALLLIVPMMLMLSIGGPIIGLLVGHPKDAPGLAEHAASFSRVLAIGAPGLMLYYCFRLYVEGHSRPLPGMICIIVGNLVNVLGNWLLIYGHAGLPRLGATGSAISTSIVDTLMAVAMFIYIRKKSDLRRTAALRQLRDTDRALVKTIAGLGMPLSLRISLRELSVFLMLVLAGAYGTAMIAGTQIALTVWRLAGPIMTGTSLAATVMLGREVGRGDQKSLRFLFWVCVELGAIVGCVVGPVLYLFARPIAHVYTNDPAVVAATVSMLHVLAVLYLLVSIQRQASAGLIALLDTRYIAVVGIGAQYGLALPLAWLCAVPLHLGLATVWYGRLASELIIVVLFILRFLEKSRERRITRPRQAVTLPRSTLPPPVREAAGDDDARLDASAPGLDAQSSAVRPS